MNRAGSKSTEQPKNIANMIPRAGFFDGESREDYTTWSGAVPLFRDREGLIVMVIVTEKRGDRRSALSATT